jgi:hypothetical protein
MKISISCSKLFGALALCLLNEGVARSDDGDKIHQICRQRDFHFAGRANPLDPRGVLYPKVTIGKLCATANALYYSAEFGKKRSRLVSYSQQLTTGE